MGMMGQEFPDDMAFHHRPLLENEVYSAQPVLHQSGLGVFRHDDAVIVAATPEFIIHPAKTLASQVIS